MKIIFNIDYKTVFGEELVLNILGTDRKGTVKASQFRMSTLDGSHWTYQMNKAQSQLPEVMDYFYTVRGMSSAMNGRQKPIGWK